MSRLVRVLVAQLIAFSCVAVTSAGAQTRTIAAGEWAFAGRDYANTRHSELDQITAANAKDLRLAFNFSNGVVRGHEAAPVVVGATMYLVTPYPNIVYALDLTRPGAPIIWKFEPKPIAASQGIACCDVVNRGVAFANGRIYFNTLDARRSRSTQRAEKNLAHTARRYQIRRDDHDGTARGQKQSAGG